MKRSSLSNPTTETKTENERPWLKRYHQAKRQRTVDLVKASVDRLVHEKQTVTLEAVCTMSRQIDPEGKGIKKAAVIDNIEAHTYYQKHSVTYQRGLGQQRSGRKVPMATVPSRIEASRDVARVRQRYLKQSRVDLVERLLAVEQEYARIHEQLAQLQFELLTLQEQLEEATQRVKPKDSKHTNRNEV